MSQKITPIPPWRLIPGKIPMDIQICGWMACLATFVFFLLVTLAYAFPESSFRDTIIPSAWTTSFWTYLGCCSYFADMAVDRQARYEQVMSAERQSTPIEAHNYETSAKAETITSTDQFRSQSAWNLQEFKDQTLIKLNPQGYPLERLLRKASIVSIFMMEGLMLVPVILYLGQSLVRPIDEVDDMATNIPSVATLLGFLPARHIHSRPPD